MPHTGTSHPTTTIGQWCFKENGRYHQEVQTGLSWSAVNFSSIRPPSASPHPSCIYTSKEVNSEAAVTRACSIFDKP